MASLDLKDPSLFRETCYINGQWVGAGSNETIDVTNPATGEMLGTIDRQYVSRILGLLAARDAPGIIAAIREIDEHFPDYARLLDDLAMLLQRIAVYQVVGSADVEPIGVGVHARVAIGRGQVEHDEPVLLHGRTSELEIVVCDPGDPDQRRLEADDLLDGVGDEARIAPQPAR